MARRGQRALLPSILALLVAILALLPTLAGCGEDSSTTGGEGSTPAQSTSATSQGQGQEEQAEALQGPAEAKGGEASIEEFGEEAEGSERRAILAVFTGYLSAIVDKDYASACEDLSAQMHEALIQLLKAKGPCAKTLGVALSPEASAIAKAQAQGKIAKVRVEEDRAFVVFHAPGAKLFYLTLVREGGEWKVASAAAAVLVPEL